MAQGAKDAVISGLSSFLKKRSKVESAQREFKNELLLQKMKQQYEAKQKEAEAKAAHEYKLKEKGAPSFMESYLAEQFEQQGGQDAGGDVTLMPTTPSFTPGGGLDVEAGREVGKTVRKPQYLPYGGDTDRFIATPRVKMKGQKLVKEVAGEREIYQHLKEKKEFLPRTFDEDDQKMLDSLSQKLGFSEKETQPSWKQQQEVNAIKQGIAQGIISIKTEWGGTDVIKPKTKDEAVEALVRGGHNPYMYEDELNAKFREGAQEEMTLPENITTTSQARDYLVGQGMTESEAIEWLRAQR